MRNENYEENYREINKLYGEIDRLKENKVELDNNCDKAFNAVAKAVAARLENYQELERKLSRLNWLLKITPQ